MKNDAIAGRMVGFKFDTASTFDDIGAMVDELAAAPPDHARAGQLAQQIRSSLDRVRAQINEIQPDPEEAPEPIVGQPVRQNAAQSLSDTGANFAGPQGTYESDTARQATAGEDRVDGAGTNGATPASAAPKDDAPAVVEMEKEVGGEKVQVTVWASSAKHLEDDGWKRVSAPREAEDGEHVVGAKVDEDHHDDEHRD